MKQINFKIEEAEYEALREYCFKERITMSEYIRSRIVLPSKKKEERAKKIPYTEEEEEVDLKTLFE